MNAQTCREAEHDQSHGIALLPPVLSCHGSGLNGRAILKASRSPVLHRAMLNASDGLAGVGLGAVFAMLAVPAVFAAITIIMA